MGALTPGRRPGQEPHLEVGRYPSRPDSKRPPAGFRPPTRQQPARGPLSVNEQSSNAAGCAMACRQRGGTAKKGWRRPTLAAFWPALTWRCARSSLTSTHARLSRQTSAFPDRPTPDLSRLTFVFAKTMPEFRTNMSLGPPTTRRIMWPCSGPSSSTAKTSASRSARYRYWYPGDGWKYWAMTTDERVSQILNRAKVADAAGGRPAIAP